MKTSFESIYLVYWSGECNVLPLVEELFFSIPLMSFKGKKLTRSTSYIILSFLDGILQSSLKISLEIICCQAIKLKLTFVYWSVSHDLVKLNSLTSFVSYLVDCRFLRIFHADNNVINKFWPFYFFLCDFLFLALHIINATITGTCLN